MNPGSASPAPATREREVFLDALARPPGPEREAFLRSACAGDDALHRSILDLLTEEARMGGFLDDPAIRTPTRRGSPAADGGATGPGDGGVALVAEKPGDRIGRYRLLEQIGEGGCGVVFMAEQEEPVRRRVALKVIKLGMDTRSVIARFEAERQALAMMDHPNIARVFDAGATETGRPYFVMELVRGMRLTEYCDRYRLTASNRLQLLIEICQAIQHAHQKGIIHRDLKPSNILVTLHDGVPVPKVIDFGIAKATEQRLTDRTLFTEFRSFLGTPAYMSPEQAEMSGLDIDTRSDIYSLGVLLYEVLTGRTPFDADHLLRGGVDEIRRTLRDVEPTRPSNRVATLSAADLTTTASQRCTEAHRLVHLLRGDLDWIAMKCLEKDRTRRYSTANALALDLQRYLDNEPVLARPPTAAYRLQKLLRRNRLMVGAVASVSLALIAGTAISLHQAVRARQAEAAESRLRQQAERERLRAEQESAAARLSEYVADINLAQLALVEGNYGRARQLVEKHRPGPGETDLRGFEWRYLWLACRGNEHVTLPQLAGAVSALAFSPDGRWIAAGLRDGIRILDVTNRTPVASLPRGAFSLTFLPDGRHLLSASRSTVRLWDTATWSELASFPEESAPLAVSPDGRWLASVRRNGVHLRDLAGGTEGGVIPETAGPLAFSPDGRVLAAASRRGLGLWRLEDRHLLVTLEDSEGIPFHRGPGFLTDHGIAFSPDGQSVVALRNAASFRGVFVISIWDATTGRETGSLPGDPDRPEHIGRIASLAFSPNGQMLVTAGWDHSIRIWDFPTRRRIGVLQGHRTEVWSLAVSPDGRSIVSGAKDGGLHLWPLQPPRDETLLSGMGFPLAFSPDSRSIVTRSGFNTLSTVNLTTREPERQLALERPRPRPDSPPGPGPGPGPGSPANLVVSADLRVLACETDPGVVRLVDVATEQVRATIAAPPRADFLALSPDGRVLLTGGWDRPIRWWEPAASTNAVLSLDGSRATFSADSQVLATLAPSNRVEIWNVGPRTLRRRFTTDHDLGFSPALSPDGRVLATAAGPDDTENPIDLWDTTTGQRLGTCTGHKQPIFSLAFSPDGRTLASSSDDSTVKLWNVATRQEMLSFRRAGESLLNLMFSPDGTLLAGAAGFPRSGSGIRLLRAPGLAEIAALEAETP